MRNNQKPRGKLYLWLMHRSYFMMRCILFGLGFTRLRNTQISIKDVFADYEQIQDCSEAPLVVSNHVSYADMFFYLMKRVSFLSKDGVGKTPLIGWHATARHSIYLNRADEKDRSKVLDLIKERVARVKEKGDLYPLLIFPEGTISNGRSLLSFKKGAFFSGDPIKIYVIKYNSEHQTIASIINISALSAWFITICQPFNDLELFEYKEAFDPEYVYKKYGISKDDPNAWEKVAAEVKTLMAFVSNMQETEDTYRETIEFEKASLDMNDNKLELAV